MKHLVSISKRFAVLFVTAAVIVVANGLLESGHSRGQATNAAYAAGSRGKTQHNSPRRQPWTCRPAN